MNNRGDQDKLILKGNLSCKISHEMAEKIKIIHAKRKEDIDPNLPISSTIRHIVELGINKKSSNNH